MNRIHLVSLILFCFGDYVSAQMRVSADFPGGSAVVVSVDTDERSVHIRPDVHKDRGWPCWWYCRLDGLSVGKPVKVTVSANPAPFRDSQVLDHTWLLPDRASISDDDVRWEHTAEANRGGSTATYAFDASAETMWVAWGPPFLPSHAESMLKQISTSDSNAELFELARTRHNRPVYAIRFGARATDAVKPSAIWVQARQHAWEAGSSWVAQGFLKWATSDDPIAARLRSKATICVVPIMDVDSVTDGAGGKASVPRDHNRDWDDEPEFPEVRAAQTLIHSLHKHHRFDVFVDLHNPSANDRKPFFFGPKIDELSSVQQRNFIRWKAIAESHIEHLEPEYRFAAYVKTQEERNRVSSNWVRDHSSPQVVAMTLETPWNRPEGTQEGYQLVGRQLGMTIARYLSTDPSKE